MTHDTAQTREALVEAAHKAALKKGYTLEGYRDAFLEALEAAGVNLMPTTLTKDMCYACMTSDQSATGADRVDYHAVLHRRYTAQLAASPYAKDAP